MTTDLVSLLLIGDSHVTGFQAQQIKVRVTPDRTLPVDMKYVFLDGAYGALDMTVTFPDGRSDLNPLFAYALKSWPGFDKKGAPLAALNPEKHLVVSAGTGLSHYDPGLEFGDRAADRLMFPANIDFVLPGQPALPTDPALTILPVALIRDMFEVLLQPMKEALTLLAREYPEGLWVMCAPPPPRDATTLTRLVEFRAGVSGAAVVVPSTLVLMKTWLLVRDSVRDICHAAGCTFIDCPPEVFDVDGFLKPELVRDGIHGNTEYHVAMTRHLVTVVASAAAAR